MSPTASHRRQIAFPPDLAGKLQDALPAEVADESSQSQVHYVLCEARASELLGRLDEVLIQETFVFFTLIISFLSGHILREKVWLDRLRLVEAALGAGPRLPTPTT